MPPPLPSSSQRDHHAQARPTERGRRRGDVCTRHQPAALPPLLPARYSACMESDCLLLPPPDRSRTQCRSDRMTLLRKLSLRQLKIFSHFESQLKPAYYPTLTVAAVSGGAPRAWPTFETLDRNQEAHFLRCSLARSVGRHARGQK